MRSFRVHVIAHLGHTLPPIDADTPEQARLEAIQQTRDSLWANDIGYTEEFTAEVIEELVPMPVEEKPIPILGEELCPDHDIPYVMKSDGTKICSLCLGNGANA